MNPLILIDGPENLVLCFTLDTLYGISNGDDEMGCLKSKHLVRCDKAAAYGYSKSHFTSLRTNDCTVCWHIKLQCCAMPYIHPDRSGTL